MILLYKYLHHLFPFARIFRERACVYVCACTFISKGKSDSIEQSHALTHLKTTTTTITVRICIYNLYKYYLLFIDFFKL